ncbi:MAG TPA: GNA1162 family protein [Myxococcales bacterium]
MKRVLLLAALTAACAKAPANKDYAKLVSANPRALLVVPVVNKSVDVDAADYFLSTLSVPLAERGYYVFPVNLVKRMLEDDGLSDASLVHGADPVRLCALFGADAVLFVTIEEWTAKYVVLSTQVTVAFTYVLKDGHTGEELWRDRRAGVYTSGDGGGGLAGAIVGAIVAKASPNYMPLARKANEQAMAYPGPGLPAGPYRPEYRKDLPPLTATEAAATPAAQKPADPK